MNKEAKKLVKKTAKIACVTCIALGGAALVASGAALKALTAGGKYLKEAIEKIISDQPETEQAEVTGEAASAPLAPDAAPEDATVEEENSGAEDNN